MTATPSGLSRHLNGLSMLVAALALTSLAAPVRAQTAATGVTLTASAPSPHVTGTAVTFTAAGQGGSGYQYRFRLWDGVTLSVVQEFGPTDIWTLPAATPPGTYRVIADVRTGPWAFKDAVTSLDYLVVVPPATGVSLTASAPSPQISGTAIVFTAAGRGSSNYQYRFRLYDGATVSVVQDFSPTATWSLPATTPPGTYRVIADVRTSPLAFKDAVTSLDFLLVVPPATGVTLAASLPSPQAAGTPVTFTAQGLGSSGYQYRFRLWDGTSLAVVRDFGPQAAWTLPGTTPAGNYRVIVDVRTSVRAYKDAVTALAFQLVVPPPLITALTPSVGSTLGGESVVLSGSGFQPGAQVSFGGLFLATVVSVSPTALAVLTPPHPAGAVDVAVTNPDDQSAVLAAGFSYAAPATPPPPTLQTVSPATGTTVGGTAVTLAGADFVSGATVTFGGAAATVNSLTATAIDVTAPAHAAGAVDVTVANPDGQASTLVGIFTYVAPAAAPPSVNSITPATGLTLGGDTVVISGRDFRNPLVTFGGVPSTPIGSTATTISVVTPAHAAGPVDVVVTNLDGQSTTVAGGYTFAAPPVLPAPALLSLSPASGSIFGNTPVVLTGQNFFTGATVSFGGVPAIVGAVTATTISVVTPIHPAGPVDVVLVNPDRQSTTLAGAYTFVDPPPVVLALNVRGCPQAGGTLVTMIGTGLANAVTVSFGGAPATGLTYNPLTGALTVTAPPSPLGAGVDGFVDVVVTNADGQLTTVPGFHYGNPPTATGFTPATAKKGDPITISGFDFTADATGPRAGLQVSFGGTRATILSKTATELVVEVPKMNPGTYSIFVVNFDGQYSVAPGTFFLPGP